MVTVLSSFAAWIDAVPNVVWSGLLASTVTLSGVLIADWRNTVRQRRQHAFDAEQSRIDRTMDIRREVYLPVSGAISRLQAHMFSLADEKDDEQNINPMTELAEACAKLAMVSTTKTAILVQRLLSDYGRVYIILKGATLAIKGAHATVAIHKKLKEDMQRDLDRVTLEISKYLESGGADPLVFEPLRRSQQSFCERRDGHAKVETDAMAQVAVEYRKFARHAIEHLAPLGEASIPVLIAIRAELGHDTEANELAQEMRRNRERELAALRELLDALDSAS